MAPIHNAARRGDLDEVMRSVQEDPGVMDLIDDHEQTALLYASENGHVEVACYLLNQGASINTRKSLWFHCFVPGVPKGLHGSGGPVGIERSQFYHQGSQWMLDTSRDSFVQQSCGGGAASVDG